MTTMEKVVEELKQEIAVAELEAMEYSLATAIREGSTVSVQVTGWGNGESACALTAASISAKARGYCK